MIHEILHDWLIHYASHTAVRLQSGQRRSMGPALLFGERRPGEAVDSAPELLMEAVRDLVAICRALNETSPAAQILQSPPMGKPDLLVSAYQAVAQAVELAREVQDDPDWHGLDDIGGALVAVLLRRVARDLEREADAWGPE